MRKIININLLIFLLFCLSVGNSRGIFGADNRKSLCTVDDDDITKLASSICLIISKNSVTPEWPTGDPVIYPPAFYLNLTGETLGDYLKEKMSANSVDNEMNFKDDLVALNEKSVLGTGVLIGERHILTVDHIFKNADGEPIDPSNFMAVFAWIGYEDYKVGGIGSAGEKVVLNPYYVFNIIGYDRLYGEQSKQFKISNSEAKMDLSVIKTDRIAGDFCLPLKYFKGNKVEVEKVIKGKELFTIGHSMGLPQVYADNARSNPTITYDSASKAVSNLTVPDDKLAIDQYNQLIFTNLDIFGGCSGSPVFVKDSDYSFQVIGLITNGEDDYEVDSTTGTVKEAVYTDKEFDKGESFGGVQTLETVKCNVHSPGEEQDYIHIPKVIDDNGTLKNRPRVGVKVALTFPSSLPNGVYFIYSRASNVGINNMGKVVYWNNNPNIITRYYTLKSGTNYNFLLLNTQNSKIYSAGISGTAISDEDSYFDERVMAHLYHSMLASGQHVVENLTFNSDVTDGEIPLVVYFLPTFPDNAFTVLRDNPASFLWDFGDGETSTYMNPTHVYTKPGKYTVTFTVTYFNGSDSYTMNNYISASNIIDSYSGFGRSVVLDEKTYICNPNNFAKQCNVTITTTDEILIVPETVINGDEEVILNSQ